MITLIACTDINDGIGTIDNELLFDFPKDKKHFQSVTSNKIVVMGRKTWESLPQKPLRKRKNYVLTSDPNFKAEGAKILRTIDEIVKLAKGRDVYIIGGGEVYNQTIKYADRLIITHVHHIHEDARVFFPAFNDVKTWKIQKVIPHKADEKHSHSFTITTYSRNKNS